MIVVISTYNREPQYVHQTIASLLLADKLTKICLVIDGNKDDDYLKYYKNDLILKYFRNEKDNEFLENYKNHPGINYVRGNYNYCRCLQLISQFKDDDCVLLEDDVVCKEGWIKIFESSLAEIKDENPFLMSLRARKKYQYPEFRPIGKYVEEIIPYEEKPNVITFFSGNQAVYFSKNFQYGELIKFFLNEPYITCDIQTSKYLLTYGVKAYHTINGLFWHVGKVSGVGTENIEVF